MSTKQTNLIITSTGSDNKKVSNTISYVNPNISNNTALELTGRIAALTTDSYLSTERVDRTELTGSKTPITLTSITISGQTITITDNVANVTLTTAQVQNGTFTITIGGAFVAVLKCMPTWIATESEMRQFSWAGTGVGTGYNNRITCTIYLTQGAVVQTGTGHLSIPESDTFGELNLQVNYTIQE